MTTVMFTNSWSFLYHLQLDYSSVVAEQKTVAQTRKKTTCRAHRLEAPCCISAA